MANLPTRNNNPGDLRDPSTGTFLTFASPEQGTDALRNDLYGKMTGNTKTGLGPDSSLLQFSSVYAPASDGNNPTQYAQNLASQMGVSTDTPIGQLNLDDFTSAVAKNEGFQGSTTTRSKQKLSMTQFAEKIKAKYPQYANVDDNTLAQKVLERYPQYGPSIEGYQVPQTKTQPQQSQGLLPNVGAIGSDLGQNIANRFQQGSEGLSDVAGGLSTGNVGTAALGALHTAGAIAGGLGDVANSALEFIPVVQALEKGIGSALGNFAETPTGQSVVKALSSIAEQHPTLAKAIGDAVNIASVVPMFKGLGLVKGAVQDAALTPLKGTLEDATKNELRGALGSQGGKILERAEARGLDPISYITSGTKTIPDIVEHPTKGFAYDSTAAIPNGQASLGQNEVQLQQMLDQGVKQNIMVNLDAAKNQMKKDVLDEFGVSTTGGKAQGIIDQKFNDIALTTGGRKWISINELNGLKRDIGADINWNTYGNASNRLRSAMYDSLKTQVENYADKAGVKGVRELNQIMGNKIEALKILASLNGAKVRQSAFGKLLREVGTDFAGAAGEFAGGKGGVPLAGVFAGRGIGRLIPGRIPITPSRLLTRGGRGTVGSSLRRGLIKTGVAQSLRSTLGEQSPQ